MNRFLMVTLGLMIASPAMAADLTPSFPSGGINPSRGIYGGMVTGMTITDPGAYAPSDLPVTLSIDGNQSGERARASVTAYTAVSARVASAGSGCLAGAIYSYVATGTKIIVSDGNGLSGSTVSVVSGGTGNASTIPANPVSMTAAKSSCTPPKLNLSWGVQSVSLDNQGWGYASPPSGTGSVSMAPDAAIAMVSTTVQTGVVSLPDKLVAASRVGRDVAGLENGAVINPVNTTGGISGSGALRLGQGISGRPLIVQKMPTSWDGAIFPDTMAVGGIGQGDASPVKFTSPLFGHGDWGGCVLNVQDAKFEQYARCGAGVSEGVVGMFKTSNQKPMLELGGGITSASGTIYSVRFLGSGLQIHPALNDVDRALIYQKSRIYSNYRNGMVHTAASGSIDSPNLWYGYLGDETTGTDSAGTYSSIKVMQDPDSGAPGWLSINGTSTITAPGSNSGDVLDTYNSQYTSPVAFIGAAGKKFVFNTMIQLDAAVKDSMTLAAEGEEMDIQTPDSGGLHAHDRKFLIHGVTYSATGKDLWSDDSYFVRIAGSNLVPRGLLIDGIEPNGNILKTDAGLQWYSAKNDLNALSLGSVLNIGQLGSTNLSGSIASLLMYAVHDSAWTSEKQGWNNGSIHLGIQDSLNPGDMSGTTPGASGVKMGGQIVWHPPGFLNGICLGSSNGINVNCGLTVDKTGLAYAQNGLHINSGKALSLVPSSGDSNGHPNIYADTPSSLMVTGSTGSPVTIKVRSVTTYNGLAPAYPVFTLATLPSSGVLDGQHARCSDCILHGIVGVDVTWNSSVSKWTDSQNNDLTTN